MIPWTTLTLAALALVLLGEYRKTRGVIYVSKPIASTGFIGLAIAAGALDSTYGRAVLTALALSWLGDVLLMKRTPSFFKAGLVAFLLGHVGFAAAFVTLGLDWAWTAIALAAITIPAIAITRWLLPKVEPARLRGPVVAYIVVITAMVAFAGGAVGGGGTIWILVAALSFYVSDLSVAWNRFVDDGFMNRALGLPAYYVAQLIFAWSVSLT